MFFNASTYLKHLKNKAYSFIFGFKFTNISGGIFVSTCTFKTFVVGDDNILFVPGASSHGDTSIIIILMY